MTDISHHLPASTEPAPDSGGDAVSSNDGGTGRSTWGRINGERVMASTAHYEPAVREDLRWLFAHATDAAQNWSMSEAAKRVRCDSSVLSKIYNDRYRDPKDESRRIVPEKVIENIRRVRHAAEAQSGAGASGGFVTTQTSEAVFRVCNAALRHNTVAFVWGASHVGKTAALEEFRRRNLGTVKLIRIEPGSGSYELMRQVARACGLSDKSSMGDLKRRVANCLDRTHLLLVDELHELTFTYQKRSKLSCMELLRWLHDTTGCGMVLCGTNILRDEIRTGKDKELLDQLVRRALTTLDLRHSPTPRDIEAFHVAYGLQAPGAGVAEAIRDLCRAKGVKALIYRLSRAKNYADSESRAVTWDDVMEEHDMLASYESGEACK